MLAVRVGSDTPVKSPKSPWIAAAIRSAGFTVQTA